MDTKAFLKVDGRVRSDVNVDCVMRRGYCTGMLTEVDGNRLSLPKSSEKTLVLENGREFKIIVGSTKYYDTLVFVSEPMR